VALQQLEGGGQVLGEQLGLALEVAVGVGVAAHLDQPRPFQLAALGPAERLPGDRRGLVAVAPAPVIKGKRLGAVQKGRGHEHGRGHAEAGQHRQDVVVEVQEAVVEGEHDLAGRQRHARPGALQHAAHGGEPVAGLEQVLELGGEAAGGHVHGRPLQPIGDRGHAVVEQDPEVVVGPAG
jgi:hypothetical protein